MDYYRKDDNFNSDSDYHPLSYEESQRMREQVRNGAVNDQIDYVKQHYPAGNNTPQRNNSGGYSNAYNDSYEELPYDVKSFRAMNSARRATVRDGLGIVIVLLILGLLTFSETFSDISRTNRRAKESEEKIATYTEVEGTIIRVRKSRDRDFSRTGHSPYYDVWLVSYKYEYNGASYENYQSFKRGSAELYGFVDTDVAGKPTKVYVNPQNPKDSIIRSYHRSSFISNAPFIFFGIFSIAAAVIVFVLFDKGYFTVDYRGSKKHIHFGD